jgi:hypothetical protein
MQDRIRHMHEGLQEVAHFSLPDLDEASFRKGVLVLVLISGAALVAVG